MAKNNNISDLLKSVADAIRAKKGTTDLINPQNFDTEIASIPTGESNIVFGEITIVGSPTSFEIPNPFGTTNIGYFVNRNEAVYGEAGSQIQIYIPFPSSFIFEDGQQETRAKLLVITDQRKGWQSGPIKCPSNREASTTVPIISTDKIIINSSFSWQPWKDGTYRYCVFKMNN